MRHIHALLLLAPLACTPTPGTTDTASNSDSETETTNASQDTASTGVTTSTVTSTTTATSGISSTTDATMTEGTSTTEDTATATATTSDEPCNYDLVCDDDENSASCLHDCGACEPDSSCDSGAENPYACPQDCPATDCNGDGVVDALSEQCDDGNAEDGDACTNDCALAACGDGYLFAAENGGTEECDDGNDVSGDGCASDCTIERRNVFITSASYKGNLGGLDGADGNCQSLAAKVGLPGTYMAWLSDGNTGPSQRFGVNPDFAGIYQLVDGTVLANGWADLTDGELAATISLSESGGVIDSTLVWTGTTPSGAPKDEVICSGWTSSNTLEKGHVGTSQQSDTWWTDFDVTQCSQPTYLYCFQVQ